MLTVFLYTGIAWRVCKTQYDLYTECNDRMKGEYSIFSSSCIVEVAALINGLSRGC